VGEAGGGLEGERAELAGVLRGKGLHVRSILRMRRQYLRPHLEDFYEDVDRQ